MKPEDWDDIQRKLYLFAGLIADWDLAAFVNAAEHGLSFGCFTDPTLWREKHEDLERVKRLAEEMLPFWRRARTMKADALQRAGVVAADG